MPPHYFQDSHNDSRGLVKFQNYERLVFLYKNEVLSDSQVIAFQDTGLRTEDPLIHSTYNEYSD